MSERYRIKLKDFKPRDVELDYDIIDDDYSYSMHIKNNSIVSDYPLIIDIWNKDYPDNIGTVKLFMKLPLKYLSSYKITGWDYSIDNTKEELVLTYSYNSLPKDSFKARYFIDELEYTEDELSAWLICKVEDLNSIIYSKEVNDRVKRDINNFLEKLDIEE